MPSGARSSVVPTLRAPENLAGLQIDRDHLAPWRLVAQQAQRRHRDRARHRERRTLLPSEIVTGRRVEPIGHGGARKQLDDVDRARGVGIEDLVDGIERGAAPVHAAAGHRKHHRALRRWRRVEAFVARRCNLLAADPAIPERNHAEHIVGRNPLRHQRRHMGRKRLRRRELLALGAALRHRAFFHRPYRLAGVAIEHEHKTLLGRLDHDIAHALAGIDRAPASAALAGRNPRRRGARSETTRPARRSRREVLRPNWHGRCCRAACRPRNPGSARTSAKIPGRALRPPTSAPRHWRDRR